MKLGLSRAVHLSLSLSRSPSISLFLSLVFLLRPTHVTRCSCVPLSIPGVALPLTVLPLSSYPALPPAHLNSSVSLGSSFSLPFRSFRPSTKWETSPFRSHPGFPPPQNLFAAANPTLRPACATFVLLGVSCETLILHLASYTRVTMHWKKKLATDTNTCQVN